MRHLTIAAITFVSTVFPAEAAWHSLTYDRGEIRLSSLTGMAGNDGSSHLSFSCVSTPTGISSLSVVITFNATGEYSVRTGEKAQASISFEERSWDIEMSVGRNDSSGFGADADTPAVLEMVGALLLDSGPVTVHVSSGPISETFAIASESGDVGAKEWLDGCTSQPR